MRNRTKTGAISDAFDKIEALAKVTPNVTLYMLGDSMLNFRWKKQTTESLGVGRDLLPRVK